LLEQVVAEDETPKLERRGEETRKGGTNHLCTLARIGKRRKMFAGGNGGGGSKEEQDEAQVESI